MKRGSKYWRFCLVRSFCINQPQVSYYPRWHAGSGTRRGGTLRKKHYSKHLNCIVLSSKTIIIKADHFQALALNSSPFSNPKSQSPPPGKGAVCGCVQRRSWSSSHARGPRLIIQWHSSPPTHKTSNSVTHKGGRGVPTDSSLWKIGDLCSLSSKPCKTHFPRAPWSSPDFILCICQSWFCTYCLSCFCSSTFPFCLITHLSAFVFCLRPCVKPFASQWAQPHSPSCSFQRKKTQKTSRKITSHTNPWACPQLLMTPHRWSIPAGNENLRHGGFFPPSGNFFGAMGNLLRLLWIWMAL